MKTLHFATELMAVLIWTGVIVGFWVATGN